MSMDIFSLPPIFVKSNEPTEYITQTLETTDLKKVRSILEDLFGEPTLFLIVHPDRHVGVLYGIFIL